MEAIVQLPNNIFYNTGISTYVWLLTNKKTERRKGKVQLIDASQAFEKLRKNQGSRNCTISDSYREAILQVYMDFVGQEADEENKVSSKIFDGDDFRYYNVTIERSLRLRSQFNVLRIDTMRYDSSDLETSQWLYQTYGEQVYEGLETEIPSIKEYLNEQEIKLTDKKLAKLLSTKSWNERRKLMEAAKELMKVLGTEVFMDYNRFFTDVCATAKKLKLDLKTAALSTIVRAMSVTDSEAAPVIKKEHRAYSKDINNLQAIFGVSEERLTDYGYTAAKKGVYVEYEANSDLRDSEKIPVKENIYEYFQRGSGLM